MNLLIPNNWLNVPLHVYFLTEKASMEKMDIIVFFEKCLNMTEDDTSEKISSSEIDLLAKTMAENINCPNLSNLKLLQYEYDIKILREAFLRVEREASKAKSQEIEMNLLLAKMRVKDEINRKSQNLLEQENGRLREKLGQNVKYAENLEKKNLALVKQLLVAHEKFDELKNLKDQQAFDQERESCVDQRKYDSCREETFQLKDELSTLNQKLALLNQEKVSQKGYFEHQILEKQQSVTQMSRKIQVKVLKGLIIHSRGYKLICICITGD